MSNDGHEAQLLVSHLTLRRVVGVLGVLLPVLLVVGCLVLGSRPVLQESISDYYRTAARDVFVGILFVIAWFLFAYRGYDRKDDVAGNLACLFALGVALFPGTSEKTGILVVHLVSAGALFLVLSYFSLFLFTKTAKGVPPTRQKKLRNGVYVVCGVVMLVCIASAAAYYAFLRTTSIAAIRPAFWLESVALWAFGCSWFVKGETLLRDPGP